MLTIQDTIEIKAMLIHTNTSKSDYFYAVSRFIFICNDYFFWPQREYKQTYLQEYHNRK